MVYNTDASHTKFTGILGTARVQVRVRRTGQPHCGNFKNEDAIRLERIPTSIPLVSFFHWIYLVADPRWLACGALRWVCHMQTHMDSVLCWKRYCTREPIEKHPFEQSSPPCVYDANCGRYRISFAYNRIWSLLEMEESEKRGTPAVDVGYTPQLWRFTSWLKSCNIVFRIFIHFASYFCEVMVFRVSLVKSVNHLRVGTCLARALRRNSTTMTCFKQRLQPKYPAPQASQLLISTTMKNNISDRTN